MSLKKISILNLIFFFGLPIFAQAEGIVPCGNGNDPGNACTLCHLIIGIQSLVDFGLELLITVAAVAIFFSGLMYILSSGNEQMLGSAKNFLGASLKGFTIVLMAWFFVNLTMWIMSANPDLGIGKENWYTFNCNTQSSATGSGYASSSSGGGSSGGGQTVGDTQGYTYDPGIEKQKKDISSDLNSLLSCMQPKLPSEAKKISSISDSAGIENCYKENWTDSVCAHTKYSCHYGGKTCEMKSYAVDFGNEKYSSEITSAAKSCGANYTANEGNHVHVSIGKKCGCN